jgi:hypothetical protein
MSREWHTAQRMLRRGAVLMVEYEMSFEGHSKEHQSRKHIIGHLRLGSSLPLLPESDTATRVRGYRYYGKGQLVNCEELLVCRGMKERDPWHGIPT